MRKRWPTRPSATAVPAARSCRRWRATPRQKTVHWQTLDCIAEPERIAALAVQAAAQGARVLVVRNTGARRHRHLAGRGGAGRSAGDRLPVQSGRRQHPDHSRFSRQDRPLLDAQVQEQMGKRRSPRPGGAGLVVVGTQTLGAKLDIDANLLITDLCPMDVLLQRLGRLHRHDRDSAQRLRASPRLGAHAHWPRPDSFVATPKPRFGARRLKNQPMGGVYIDLRCPRSHPPPD